MVAVGVDLGGTNVRAACFDSDGIQLGDRAEVRSRAQEGVDATVESVVGAVQLALAGRVADCVGIAIPGHIDDGHGLVRWAPNFGKEVNGHFVSWRDVPLKGLVEERLATRVVTGNDANLAALGEYRFGSGKNSASCLVLLTVGTGIGGGVVLGPSSIMGRSEGTLVLLGGNQGGVELGHMIIQGDGLDCNAGSYGALEAYCQRDAIVKRAVNRLGRGRASILNDLCERDYSKLTPRMVSEAADQGDELAKQVWNEVGTFLGIGIASCINIFAPKIVAIGGQIARADEHLLGPARIAARDAAIPSLFADCEIVRAEQIDDAGILGAAALALRTQE